MSAKENNLIVDLMKSSSYISWSVGDKKFGHSKRSDVDGLSSIITEKEVLKAIRDVTSHCLLLVP